MHVDLCRASRFLVSCLSPSGQAGAAKRGYDVAVGSSAARWGDKGIGLACPPLDNQVEQALESLGRGAGKADSSLYVGRPGRGGVLSASGRYTTGSGMNPSPASQNDKEIRERWTGVAGVYVSGWMLCGRSAIYLLLRLLGWLWTLGGTDPGLPADFHGERTNTRVCRMYVRVRLRGEQKWWCMGCVGGCGCPYVPCTPPLCKCLCTF